MMGILKGGVSQHQIEWKKLPQGPSGMGEVQVNGKTVLVRWKKDDHGLSLEFPYGTFGFDIHGILDLESSLNHEVLYQVRCRNQNSFYSQARFSHDLEKQAQNGRSVRKKSVQSKAQMPGKIIKVRVKEGEPVEKGQVLLVMEAMKMENEIKATQSGKIEKIFVQEGQAVESGAPLLVIT